MASKENQEALGYLLKYQKPKVSYKDDGDYIRKILSKLAKSRETLQQAINELEIYKKALEIADEYYVGKRKWLYVEGYSFKETVLEQAKEELNDGKERKSRSI